MDVKSKGNFRAGQDIPEVPTQRLLTSCKGKYGSYKMEKPENFLTEDQNLHHQGGEMSTVCTTLPREHFHQECIACIQPAGNI